MLILSSESYYKDDLAKDTIEHLTKTFNFDSNSYYIYYEYPLFADIDDKMVQPKLLIVSPLHGIIIINMSITTSKDEAFF